MSKIIYSILFLSFITTFLFFAWVCIEKSTAADAKTSASIAPTAIVFKNGTRYNAFVQGKFERLFNDRIIEFPIGKLSNREILGDIKEYGLKIDHLVLVDIREDIYFQQTAARSGGKQGIWTSSIKGLIEFYNIDTLRIVSSRSVQITKQYDDSGSIAGNALRSLAEKALGNIYYYEQTPDQKILYELSDQVKGAMGIIIEEMAKADIKPGISRNPGEQGTHIDTKKSLFENSLDDLARQIIAGITTNKKMRIAVTEFTWTDESEHALEAYIAEELTTRVSNYENIIVVERALLNRAIEELKFNLSDLVDPAHAQHFGRFVGADTILAGTITDIGYKYKLNCRLIDTEDGTVYSAVSGSIYPDERLEGLIEERK